jgi:hypothetical protein
VELYDLLLNELPRLEFRKKRYPSSKPVKEKLEFKLVDELPLKDYNRSRPSQIERENEYQLLVNNALVIAKDINLQYTLEDLREDFKQDRTILKSLFGNIFSLYGISLTGKMLDSLFGKEIKTNDSIYPSTVMYIDNIQLFAKRTVFEKSLAYQFSRTRRDEAYGVFSAFFMRAAGLLKLNKNDSSWGKHEHTGNFRDNNPFWNENIAMQIIAKSVAILYIRNGTLR